MPKPPPGPVTIADLVCDRELIEIGCTACGHYGYFYPDALDLPDRMPVLEVFKRCSCSKRGVKGQGYSMPDERSPH